MVKIYNAKSEIMPIKYENKNIKSLENKKSNVSKRSMKTSF